MWPRKRWARWLLTGLAISVTPTMLPGCGTPSSSSSASFCDTYTVVYDRTEDPEASEFDLLHPQTQDEIRDNQVACVTLCPAKCPLLDRY